MYQSMYQGFSAQQNQASLARAGAWTAATTGVGNILAGAVSEGGTWS